MCDAGFKVPIDLDPSLNDHRSHKVVCLSWIPTLAETRRQILACGGYTVVSLLGSDGIDNLEKIGNADLLVLAHSVPLEQKKRALTTYKRVSHSPVLSLLLPYQCKLHEADYGVEAFLPDEFLNAVKNILRR